MAAAVDRAATFQGLHSNIESKKIYNLTPRETFALRNFHTVAVKI